MIALTINYFAKDGGEMDRQYLLSLKKERTPDHTPVSNVLVLSLNLATIYSRLTEYGNIAYLKNYHLTLIILTFRGPLGLVLKLEAKPACGLVFSKNC